MASSPPAWLSALRRRPVLLASAVVGLPLLVAAVALRSPRWFPTLDLAMTELRVRDVGGSHTPLIGLPGRIGRSLDEQGSHPGPVSFWVLALPYRLLGSSAWALQAAAVLVHGAAAAAALVLARRRAGFLGVAVAALVLAGLVRGYGVDVLAEPWNPFLPLLAWVVVLLGTWSVLCGDRWALPVTAVAATLCAQTHTPYLGSSLGLGAVATVAFVVAYRRLDRGSPEARQARQALVVASLLVLALWAPLAIDELDRSPGNLSILSDHFGSPPEEPVGFGDGIAILLRQLDPVRLVAGVASGSLLDTSGEEDRSVVGGVVVVVAWLAAAGVAVARRHRELVRLHLVVGAGLVLGAVTMARIFGKVWYYLLLWGWGLAAFVLVAIGATVAATVGGGSRGRGWTTGIAAAVAVAIAVPTAVRAADAERTEERLSSTLGALLPGTVAALERGDGPATGRDGRYVVAWNDVAHFGSQGYGLMSELERDGFDAGLTPPYHVPATDHRVFDDREATAQLNLVNGEFIERWRATPGAVEVAFVDPRSPGEVREFDDLQRQAITELEDAGLGDLAGLVDGNLFGVAIDDRVPRATAEKLDRMLHLGIPTAVFLSAPGAQPS